MDDAIHACDPPHAGLAAVNEGGEGAVTNRLVAKRPFESLEVCARTEPIDLEENVTHAD